MEKGVSRLFGGLACIAVVASGAVLAWPDGVSQQVGGEVPHRVWAPFAVAWLATSAVMAALVAHDLRRYAHLLLVLAASSASVVLAFGSIALASVGWPPGAVLAVVTCGVALAAGPLVAWVRLWIDAAPSEATARVDHDVLAAILETVVPSADASQPAGRDEGLARRLRESWSGEPPMRLRLTLRMVEWAAWPLGGERFSSASPAVRDAVFARLLGARWSAVHVPIATLRERAIDARFAAPDAFDRVGFDLEHRFGRIAEGPNARSQVASPVEETRTRAEMELGVAPMGQDGSGADEALTDPLAIAPNLRLVRGGPGTT